MSPRHELTEDDVVIAVMGITGSGKTEFIQHFCQQDLNIGHGLQSCTAKVDIVPCIMPDGKQIYCIDTPGYDDTYRSDTEILSELADWLVQSYSHNIKLTGIIYLHRITDVRVGGSGMKNLRMFSKLCGPKNLGSVVLATTMWGHCKPADGERREAQLESDGALWQPLFNRGACLMRQDREKESGQEILDYLINRSRKVALDIQVEMVDEKKKLSDTGAGREVQEDLDKFRAEQEDELQKILLDMKEAFNTKDAERQEELREYRAQVDSQIRAAEQETRRLERSREELRAEMKAEHRLEVAALKEEASKREHELAKTVQQNNEQHARLERELASMKDKINDSRLKDSELAALRDQASKREEELRTTSKENTARFDLLAGELKSMRQKISRSQMKEGFNYKYKFLCPSCGAEYLYNKRPESIDCDRVGCETNNVYGSGSPYRDPYTNSGEEQYEYL